MNERRKSARFAGLLYLVIVLTGFFTVMYVPGKLIVRGDAVATANRILASESLFRLSMVIGLVSTVAFLFLALALYRLLKEVNPQQACTHGDTGSDPGSAVLVDELNQTAALVLIRGADFLSVFDKPQREALAMLFLDFNNKGTSASELFWGLWLFPLGLLVFRSGYLPRTLGVWLIINCFAYVAISVTGLLLPQHLEIANKIAFPALLGELAFMLWLLIVGAKPKPTAESASASSSG